MIIPIPIESRQIVTRTNSNAVLGLIKLMDANIGKRNQLFIYATIGILLKGLNGKRALTLLYSKSYPIAAMKEIQKDKLKLKIPISRLRRQMLFSFLLFAQVELGNLRKEKNPFQLALKWASVSGGE